MLRSPLSWQGNKYKLLSHIVDTLPDKRKTFIDMFGGSGTVALNMVPFYPRVVYNEYDSRVFAVLKAIKGYKRVGSLINRLDKTIDTWNLGRSEEDYYDFREHVRSKDDPILNWLCAKYAHSSLFRFNGKGEFNAPIAKDGRNYSPSKQRNTHLREVWERLQNITLWNRPYEEVVAEHSPKSLFRSGVTCYCDPPYLASGANIYRFAWTEDHEQDFLDYLSYLDSTGIDLMLSNVLQHRQFTNPLLKKWLRTQKFSVYRISYKGDIYKITNSQGKPKSDHDTIEIIGYNYENTRNARREL